MKEMITVQERAYTTICTQFQAVRNNHQHMYLFYSLDTSGKLLKYLFPFKIQTCQKCL